MSSDSKRRASGTKNMKEKMTPKTRWLVPVLFLAVVWGHVPSHAEEMHAVSLGMQDRRQAKETFVNPLAGDHPMNKWFAKYGITLHRYIIGRKSRNELTNSKQFIADLKKSKSFWIRCAWGQALSSNEAIMPAVKDFLKRGGTIVFIGGVNPHWQPFLEQIGAAYPGEVHTDKISIFSRRREFLKQRYALYIEPKLKHPLVTTPHALDGRLVEVEAGRIWREWPTNTEPPFISIGGYIADKRGSGMLVQEGIQGNGRIVQSLLVYHFHEKYGDRGAMRRMTENIFAWQYGRPLERKLE